MVCDVILSMEFIRPSCLLLACACVIDPAKNAETKIVVPNPETASRPENLPRVISVP